MRLPVTVENGILLAPNSNLIPLFQYIRKLHTLINTTMLRDIARPNTLKICLSSDYGIDLATSTLRVKNSDIESQSLCTDRLVRLQTQLALHQVNPLLSSVSDTWNLNSELDPQVAFVAGFSAFFTLLNKRAMGDTLGTSLASCAMDDGSTLEMEHYRR